MKETHVSMNALNFGSMGTAPQNQLSSTCVMVRGLTIVVYGVIHGSHPGCGGTVGVVSV